MARKEKNRQRETALWLIVPFVGILIVLLGLLLLAKYMGGGNISSAETSELIRSSIWPVTIASIALSFYRPLSRLIDRIQSGTVKAAGAELTFDAETREAAENLLRAKRKRASANQSPWAQDADFSLHRSAVAIPQRYDLFAELNRVRSRLTEGALEVLRLSNILWVDDHPRNNTYEMKSLQSLGIQIETTRSTDEAIQELSKRSYDLVISDLARPPDDVAGLTLARQIRDRDLEIKLIIYTSPRGVSELLHRRGIDQDEINITSDPEELFDKVIDALLK